MSKLSPKTFYHLKPGDTFVFTDRNILKKNKQLLGKIFKKLVGEKFSDGKKRFYLAAEDIFANISFLERQLA